MTRTIQMTIEYETTSEALGVELDRHASGKAGPLAHLIGDTVKVLHARVGENPNWIPAPAGSYTRTDEEGTDTRTREHLLAEEERLRKLEESLRAHLSRTINRAERAEQALVEMTAHRDQCRDTAIKWQMEANRAVQPRALTPDDITDAMVERGAEKFRSLSTAMSAHARVSIILTAALTEPTRPEGAEGVECALLDADEAGVLASDQERIGRLADFLAERGVRVTGAES